MNPLKPLWEKLKVILKGAPDSPDLAPKVLKLTKVIDSEVETYQKLHDEYQGKSGRQKGLAGRALSQAGRALRGHVLELSKLLDTVKDQKLLSSLQSWRSEVERKLNEELGQQIRVASAEGVIRRFNASRTPNFH